MIKPSRSVGFTYICTDCTTKKLGKTKCSNHTPLFIFLVLHLCWRPHHWNKIGPSRTSWLRAYCVRMWNAEQDLRDTGN